MHSLKPFEMCKLRVRCSSSDHWDHVLFPCSHVILSEGNIDSCCLFPFSIKEDNWCGFLLGTHLTALSSVRTLLKKNMALFGALCRFCMKFCLWSCLNVTEVIRSWCILKIRVHIRCGPDITMINFTCLNQTNKSWRHVKLTQCWGCKWTLKLCGYFVV